MFREMRRKKQLLSDEGSKRLLTDGKTGVLGVSGDDGYPYTVPVNYVYADGAIYFHCAKAGHKIDAIRRNNRVSFCVIDKEDIIPEEFTTYFRSVIAFGKASEVTEDGEKLHAVRFLNQKYSPGLDERGNREIQKSWGILCVIKIEVEHLTGKEAVELAKNQPK